MLQVSQLTRHTHSTFTSSRRRSTRLQWSNVDWQHTDICTMLAQSISWSRPPLWSRITMWNSSVTLTMIQFSTIRLRPTFHVDNRHQSLLMCYSQEYTSMCFLSTANTTMFHWQCFSTHCHSQSAHTACPDSMHFQPRSCCRLVQMAETITRPTWQACSRCSMDRPYRLTGCSVVNFIRLTVI